jgi:putative phage-type endonuclease
MYFSDLEDLVDILDDIVPDDVSSLIFNEEEIIDLTEIILEQMEIYVNNNPKEISEPDFHDVFYNYIEDIIYTQFEHLIKINDTTGIIETQIEDIIDDTFEIFYTTFFPRRSWYNTFILNQNINKNYISEQIEYLKTKPQPTQRTKEWYLFRHNLITASNAYKAFENQSSRNQLIFEKCQPLITDEELDKQPSQVNINTTLHWGQKYEPLSVMIYENNYKTEVGDFGCIQHEQFSFLGASPDGINIDPNSKRYGRMLEIKNIVNREIDGIPKKEYWIQMQLQMEVCDLNECDFLETKFTEYENESSFLDDYYTCVNDNDNENENDIKVNEDTNIHKNKDFIINKTEDDLNKGVIIYFAKKDGNPYYLYMPLNIKYKYEMDEWIDEQLSIYESESYYGYTWIKNIYWKLEEISCVLVERNKKWFQYNISELADIWKIIEEERISGYEHRAPNRKPKKPLFTEENKNNTENECLLNINKETGKIVLTKPKPKPNTIEHFFSIKKIDENQNITSAPPPPPPLIKIRTQSFDECKNDI